MLGYSLLWFNALQSQCRSEELQAKPTGWSLTQSSVWRRLSQLAGAQGVVEKEAKASGRPPLAHGRCACEDADGCLLLAARFQLMSQQGENEPDMWLKEQVLKGAG